MSSVSSGDDLIEGSLAERVADGTEQLDGELTMAIWEGLCSSGSQLPVHGRSPAAGRLGHRASDHSGCFQRVEVPAQLHHLGEIGCLDHGKARDRER